MSILFRRVRGRAAGHVITVNPLLICSIEPTSWGGSEINFSDVYAIVSRDSPHTVQQLLEGRLRLCQTPLCDRDTVDAYSPLCARCRDRSVGTPKRAYPENIPANLPESAPAHNLVVSGGRHGFA